MLIDVSPKPKDENMSSNMFKKQKDFKFTVIIGGMEPEHIYSQKDRIRTCTLFLKKMTQTD